jgi:hypothetical protein
MGWLRRVLATFFGMVPPPRPSKPTQSSFHLAWLTPPGAPVVAVAATLEVEADPDVDSLYFWALQASFSDATGSFGGAHTGLQWNPRFPGSRAVNWGGYHDQRFGGAVLDGTGSALPSTPNDPNTRDYAWAAGRQYRFRISPGSTPGLWRASVTDLAAAETVVIREVECRGDRLTGMVMWSEVFADCDDPSVTVRWSDLAVERPDGTVEAVTAVETRYQAESAGGCRNTNSFSEGVAFAQTTNTTRINRVGTRLSL